MRTLPLIALLLLPAAGAPSFALPPSLFELRRTGRASEGKQDEKPGSRHRPEALGKKFPHSASCPKKCKTCELALARACEYLAKSQGGTGAWEGGNGGTVVVTSIAGLALMANGSNPLGGPYQRNVERAAQFLLRTVAPGHKGKGKTASGQEFEGFGNWDLGFAAMFLAEYFYYKASADIRDRLQFMIDKIKEQREPNGGWGHAPNFAYKDLVVASTACMAGLGCLKSVGFKVPDDVVLEGVKYYESTSAGGTVGYSPREGQKGWGNAGRASGAAFAMFKLGAGGKYFERVSKFVRQGIKTIPEDHASPTLHYLFGGIYSFILGLESWMEYKTHFLDMWLAMQQQDGSVQCPTDPDVKATLGMDTDNMVGPNYTTSVFALVFALPYGRSLLPKPKATQGTPTADKPKGRPFLGFRAQTFAGSVEVLSVTEKGPAEAAGVAVGDLVVEFKGKKVEKTAHLRAEIDKCSPGQKASLVVLRGGERRTIEVKVGALEEPKKDDEGDDVETDGPKKNPPSTEEGEPF
ncbi:MAG: PDZ domain-containing protein [Planctomycetes bacterium]|nr:PDZ domain-containing protein [Planctomycetota bacterium]